MYSYKTHGTCATKIDFDIIDGKLHHVHFTNGCPGNLQAMSVLLEGMDAQKAAQMLNGIHCGEKNTSCSDQLSKAISEHLGK
jgi:uncharacterized protein (TIGR03905 family)